MNPTRAIILGLFAGSIFVLLACFVGHHTASAFFAIFGGWMFVRYYRALIHDHRT